MPLPEEDPEAIPEPALGRRERNKAATRARILQAGLDLFAVTPYNSVTTQQLAERADVSEGTLFNYVGSKGQLLLQTTNYFIESRIRNQIADRRTAVGEDEPVAEQLRALLEPIVDLSLAQPKNFAGYHREILFGPDSEDRDAAIAVLTELEDRIGEIILTAGHRLTNGLDAHRAGRLVWSSLYLEIVSGGLQRPTLPAQHEALGHHLDALLHGLIETG